MNHLLLGHDLLTKIATHAGCISLANLGVYIMACRAWLVAGEDPVVWREVALRWYPRIAALSALYPSSSYKQLCRSQHMAIKQTHVQATPSTTMDDYVFTVELFFRRADLSEDMVGQWTGRFPTTEGNLSCQLWDEAAAPQWCQPREDDLLWQDHVAWDRLFIRILATKATSTGPCSLHLYCMTTVDGDAGANLDFFEMEELPMKPLGCGRANSLDLEVHACLPTGRLELLLRWHHAPDWSDELPSASWVQYLEGLAPWP